MDEAAARTPYLIFPWHHSTFIKGHCIFLPHSQEPTKPTGNIFRRGNRNYPSPDAKPSNSIKAPQRIPNKSSARTSYAPNSAKKTPKALHEPLTSTSSGEGERRGEGRGPCRGEFCGVAPAAPWPPPPPSAVLPALERRCCLYLALNAIVPPFSLDLPSLPFHGETWPLSSGST